MADRTATSSTTVTVDISEAGLVKWNRAALTGDVTAGSGSNATAIAADAVTNAMLANMEANTVKVNATSGAANPTNLPVSASSIVGRGATGDITDLLLGEDFDITDGVISVVGGGGGGGEVNTVSNIGTAGVGVYKQKTGVDFELKKINAGSSKVTITDDTANNEIDIDVAEANLNLANIGGTLSLATQITGALPVTSLPALTGAVTTSAGSAATTLASNAVTTVKITDANVTNAKLATAAAYTLKGNATSSTAAVTDIALTAESFLGRTPTGAVQPITPVTGLNILDDGTMTASVQWNDINLLDASDTIIPWTVRVDQDVLDLNVIRLNTNGEFIDKDDNVLSTTAEVADYAALVALDAAVYENYAFVVDSGLNRSVWVSNGTAFTPLNGQYTQARVNIPGVIVIAPAAAITFTAANNGGTVRLTTASNASHGLTTTPAVGASIYVTAGTGWTAGSYHQISAVDDTSGVRTIDLTTTWASQGAPTVTLAGGEIPFPAITLPVLRTNSTVILEFGVTYSIDGTGSSRRLKMYLGSTMLNNNNITSNTNTQQNFRWGFKNQTSTSAQLGLCGENSSGYAAGTFPTIAATETTSTANTLTVAVLFAAGATPAKNVTMQLQDYTLLIRG